MALLIAAAPTLSGRAGFEGWEGEVEPGGRKFQGFGVAMLQLSLPVSKGAFTATFDSDTLETAIAGIELLPHLHLAARLRGEYAIAGLLPDYVRRGTRLLARGFNASYLEAATSGKLLLAPHYLDLEVGIRRWAFEVRKDTDPFLAVPPNTWMGSAVLRYTYWDLARDPSLFQPHRTRLRTRGVAFGVEAGTHLLSDPNTQPFLTPESPGSLILRQWIRSGVELTEALRLQADEWAEYGVDENDLTRSRIGGTAPYFIPLPGAAWATFVSSHHVVGRASLVASASADVELGASLVGAFIGDFDRGESGRRHPPYPKGGVGLAGELFLDARWGEWQLDLSVGHFEPIDRASWPRSSPVSAWASIGYAASI